MKSNELEKAVQESLEKVYEQHLPKSQATWLKKRLEEIEELEEELKEAKEKDKESRKAIERLERALDKSERQRKESEQKFLDLQQEHYDISERERNVSDREIKQEVNDLKTKLAAEERVANKMVDFLGTLTKAPQVRNTLHKSTCYNYNTEYDNNTGKYEDKSVASEDVTVTEEKQVD